MKNKFTGQILFLVIISSLLFGGCNAVKSRSSAPNYKETKQMVLDIIRTKEGKEAVQEAAGSTASVKKASDAEIKKLAQGELLSDKNTTILKEMYQDPKFASQLGKSLKKENQNLIKDLMKDPEYRKMLLETMNDPEYQKMILDTMKSTAYRKQMMTVIKESLKSPLFQEDLMKLMEKANEEALRPKKKGEDSKTTGQGSNDNKHTE